jgi:hypothetical protein
MTSSVGLSAIFANVVVLLVLAGVGASPRMSQLARLVIATFALGCAWLITAAFDALRAPEWAMFMGVAVIVVSIVVVITTLHLWTHAGHAGETQPDHQGDDGGGGPRRHRPDGPRLGGGGRDPSWWPEFERQLASYLAERERETRQPAVLPTEPGTTRHQTARTTHRVARITPPADN